MLFTHHYPHLYCHFDVSEEYIFYLLFILIRIFLKLITSLLELLLDKLFCLVLSQVLFTVVRRDLGRLCWGCLINASLIDVNRLAFASCCSICYSNYVALLFTMLISIISWFTLQWLFLLLRRWLFR